jgi:hypothetical protein
MSVEQTRMPSLRSFIGRAGLSRISTGKRKSTKEGDYVEQTRLLCSLIGRAGLSRISTGLGLHLTSTNCCRLKGLRFFLWIGPKLLDDPKEDTT